MRYVKPYYYDEFRCIADKCPDSCCTGWQIVIDEETLKKYEKGSGEFETRLQNSIDWQEGCFLQKKGRCAMLNDRNLCDIVIQKGEEWLCNTCDRYPRHVEEFAGVRELSLSLSCPVAAERMLLSEEKLHFLTKEDEEPEEMEEAFEDFDYLLFTLLEDAREVLFSIVQDREIPLKNRMELVMYLAEDMQCALDESRLFEVEEILKSYKEKADLQEKAAAQDKAGGEWEKCRKGFDFLKKLEPLRENWQQVLSDVEKSLYLAGEESYLKISEDFNSRFVTLWGKEKWEIFGEQILMFFLYTYFCGAVYDECIYSKAALSVFSVYAIEEMIKGQWILGKEQMTKEECVRLAYSYAREVEHSDNNLNSLEEWFMKYFDEK